MKKKSTQQTQTTQDTAEVIPDMYGPEQEAFYATLNAQRKRRAAFWAIVRQISVKLCLILLLAIVFIVLVNGLCNGLEAVSSHWAKVDELQGRFKNLQEEYKELSFQTTIRQQADPDKLEHLTSELQRLNDYIQYREKNTWVDKWELNMVKWDIMRQVDERVGSDIIQTNAILNAISPIENGLAISNANAASMFYSTNAWHYRAVIH